MKKKVASLVVSVSLIILICSFYQRSLCMDITPEEWKQIRKMEEQERILKEREEQELQEAIKRSEEEKERQRVVEEERKKQEIKLQKAAQLELERKARELAEQKERTVAIPPLQEFRLPRLTDEQMLAGAVLDAPHYKFYIIQPGSMEFKKLHSEGNMADRQFLADVFFKTIFQYYTKDYLYNRGFDLEYNYLMFKDPNLKVRKYDLSKFKSLAKLFNMSIPQTREDINELVQTSLLEQLIMSFPQAVDMLKQNKLLQQLGIAYMRQKIVTEKLQTLVRTVGEQILPLLLKHDRFAIDLQTMIYHFMKEAYEKYIDNLKAAQTDPQRKAAQEFLATFVPSFTQYPYYNEILPRLGELSQPMSITEKDLPELLKQQ